MHNKLIGYLLWIFGFTGSHRFYYGRPVTGTIWFFTGGLFLIGWIIDLFLIPSMDASADRRYVPGKLDRGTRPWHFGSDTDPYRALTPRPSDSGAALASALQSSWLDRLTKDIWHG